MTRFIGCATAVVLAMSLNAWADEDEKVPLDKVPAKVRDAVKAKYSKAEIVMAGMGDVDGTKVFEFELKQGEKKWEAAFTPDGKFHSAEEPIATEADLPAKVKEGLRKKYPDAKLVSIEKETSGEGDAEKVVFEIVVQKGTDKVEVQFDVEGKFLREEKVGEKKVEEKEVKLPKAVADAIKAKFPKA